jgi:hypothetical protein
VRKGSVMSVLRTNIDLGRNSVFGGLWRIAGGDRPDRARDPCRAARVADHHSPRNAGHLAGLPDGAQHVFCAAYVASDMGALGKVIEEYIFCLMYPNALLRGIAEITEAVLAGSSRVSKISMDTPYIVHDRVIFGELFSLIQLESSWCRGYMMLQSEENRSSN